MPAIPGYKEIATLNNNSCYIFQFVKKYGNVLSLNFGNVTSVVVTGLPLIKKAFTHMEQDILKRPVTPIQECISKNNGKFNEQHGVCIIVFM